MGTYRMLPPADVQRQTQVVNDRTYRGTPGAAYDINYSDAMMLSANGWITVARSGTSLQRPADTIGPDQRSVGTLFYDVSLSKVIAWDGANWRDGDGNAV
jgi:hypothetical protein